MDANAAGEGKMQTRGKRFGRLFGGILVIFVALALPWLALSIIYWTAGSGKVVTAGANGCDTIALNWSRTEGVFGLKRDTIASDSGSWAPEGTIPNVDLRIPAQFATVRALSLSWSIGKHYPDPDCIPSPDHSATECLVTFPSPDVELRVEFQPPTADAESRTTEIEHYVRTNMMCAYNTPVAS